MDAFSLIRTLGALGVVLGLLAGALWLVRRYDIRLPGRASGGSDRRVELVERMAVDGRRSVVLIRRDGREHLILLAPEGPLLVESAIVRDKRDTEAAATRASAEEARAAKAAADAAAMRESFANMVERASGEVRGKARAVRGAVKRMRAGEPGKEEINA